METLIRDFTVVLCQWFVVAGCHSDDGAMAHIVDIHADNHGAGCAQLLSEGQLVEVKSWFSVHLSHDVGEDAQLRDALLHFRFKHELRSKTKSVEVLLDSWLIFSIWDQNENDSNIRSFSTRKSIFDAMNELDVVISFVVESESILSKLLIVWDLHVLRLIPKLDTKSALYFPESSNDVVRQVLVILVINESPLSFWVLTIEISRVSINFQRLKMFNSSIYEFTELLWLTWCWIDNRWFSQLLTVDVHQVLFHLNTPWSKCGIICKLRNEVENLLLSLVGIVDLVLLEVSHFSLVLSEVLWEACFVAKLSWQVNSFGFITSRLVDIE